MARLWRALALFAVALTLVGCAGGSHVAEQPTGLSEVNKALDGVNATIVWRSGERLKNLEWVRVSVDSIRYRRYTEPGGADRWAHPPPPQRDEPTPSRPIDEVDRIVAHVGGGGGLIGFAIGAVPGVFISATSALSCRSTCGLGAVLGLYYGGMVALAGGLTGALIGNFVDTDHRVVYRHPVDQYLEF